MPSWLLSLILGAGAGVYFYNFLAKHNGNANPKGNATIAGIGGFVVFLLIFSLVKLVLKF